MKLVAVTLDCPDPLALCDFYERATGLAPYPGARSDFAGLQGPAGLLLGFQRVDDYRAPRWPDQTEPQQSHLDFDLDEGESLDEAVERLQALGATQPECQPEPTRWRVMLDPVGHAFCIIARRRGRNT